MDARPAARKQLPERWVAWLHSQPETGMGYQTVEVVLRGGAVFPDVAIIDSHLIGEVRGHDDIPFDPDDISDLRLTHNPWTFRR
jgi:hypothetical protein